MADAPQAEVPPGGESPAVRPPQPWRRPRLESAPRPAGWAERVELFVLLVVLILAGTTPPLDARGAPNTPFKSSLNEATGGGLCLPRRLTGVPCGGCGLTRGFVQLAHGRLLATLQLNPLTPFVFLWVLGRFAESLAQNAGRRLCLGIPNRWRWRFYGGVGLGFVVLTLTRVIIALAGLPPTV